MSYFLNSHRLTKDKVDRCTVVRRTSLKYSLELPLNLSNLDIISTTPPLETPTVTIKVC